MKNIYMLVSVVILISCSAGNKQQPKDQIIPVDTLEKTNTSGFNPDEKPIVDEKTIVTEENSIDGTYRSFSNVLKIKTIHSETIEVTLCIASEDCEMGCVTSSFHKTDLGYQGEFKDFHPDAIFIITVNNKKVIIETEATDLEDYLGANCFITGEYK